jgi:hypothetical protein
MGRDRRALSHSLLDKVRAGRLDRISGLTSAAEFQKRQKRPYYIF